MIAKAFHARLTNYQKGLIGLAVERIGVPRL